MAIDQMAIKSRSRLLFVAAFALLLMNVRNFIAGSHAFTRIASIVGELLFFFVLWSLIRAHGEPPTEPEAPHASSWTIATLAITGTALLLVSRFVHLEPLLHGLSNIAGWHGHVDVAAEGFKFSPFLALLWLTVSALTYLLLSRRKPTPSPSALN